MIRQAKPVKLNDGSLAYPIKGFPPKCPEGYVKKQDDEWVCIPAPEPCKYRTEKEFEGCCTPFYKPFCVFFNELILLDRCLTCKERSS